MAAHVFLRRSLILVLAAVMLPNGAIRAQNQILGFAGLRWGATRAAIVARFGKPTEDVVDSSLERLNYVQGPDSGYLLVVSRQRGLVAVVRVLPSGSGSQCSATLRADRDRIAEQLRSLTPVETRTPDPSGGSCGGFKQWDVLWRDREGDRLLLSVDVAKHRLYLSYTSPLAPN
jgi:hypothetical protein